MIEMTRQPGASEGVQGDEITGLHTANRTSDWLQCNGQKVIDYPPYSTDITSNNLCLFEHHKQHLTNKQFATDTDMQQAVTSWLWTLDNEFLYAGIQAIPPQWDRCLCQ
jgi:hypothetical protein